MKLSSIRFGILGFLLLLTVVALLPWNPVGPFDARDYSALPNMTVEYPAWSGLIEPLVAPGHMLFGAPDFRLAFGAVVIWLAVAALLWGWWRGGVWWRRGVRMLAAPLVVAWCFVAYVLFISHVHFPGWRLSVAADDVLIADLQSHTVGSHDGLVRAPVNFAWHEARGYNVTAITEHDYTSGSFHAKQVAGEQFPAMAVIAGVEESSEYGGFLLGLGMREGVGFPAYRPKGVTERDAIRASRVDYSRRFVQAVHQDHGGAVISMAWLLRAQDVYALAEAGVDGFEIVNNGHPDIPQDVREAMLALERAGKVVLVSSTDWHGWSGFTRTWTVLRVPGATQMTVDERAAAVVDILRARDAAAITPVVAGYLGPPSTLRLIFTPLVETIRYAAELSWPRVAGWWLWGGLLFFVLPWFARRRFRGLRLLVLTWLGGVGGALLWRGLELFHTTTQGDVVRSRVTGELGAMAMYAGLPLLLLAVVLLALEVRRAVSGKAA